MILLALILQEIYKTRYICMLYNKYVVLYLNIICCWVKIHSWTKETLQYKNIDINILFFYRRNISTLYQCLPGWIDYTGKVRFVWNSLERYVIEHSRIPYFRAKCRARAGDLCHVCTQLTAVGIKSKKNNLFFPILFFKTSKHNAPFRQC